MLTNVRETQRFRVTDQETKHAVAARQIADRVLARLIDPDRQTPLKLPTPLIQDPERRSVRAPRIAIEGLASLFRYSVGADTRARPAGAGAD